MNTPILLTLNALALIALAAFHFQPEPQSLPYAHAGLQQPAQRAVMTRHPASSSVPDDNRQTTAAFTDTPDRLTF
ncbi:hypothetical protein HX882_33785 [Pseudomonas gingeri]|uniref:Uncharacterized protein n=1 Tax=Pseudomonas gingeri TaxID=117681 RepID=A0A7Y8C6W4_9PSED|nr:hypothetical protein [Pseudomonas gingeri]NWC00847.1 hypothetical protein [Pseudomonas gingeri]NWD77810.1 hypothetical protein [Pseudomonas gingeri]